MKKKENPSKWVYVCICMCMCELRMNYDTIYRYITKKKKIVWIQIEN